MSLRLSIPLVVVLEVALTSCSVAERPAEARDAAVADSETQDAFTVETSGAWQQEGVRAVSSSARTLCAVMTSGHLACWGQDEALGLLGDGEVSLHSRSVPTLVGASTDWVAVSSGPYMHCARNAASETWCWGHAASPGFGDPALAKSVFAEPVKTPLAFVQLALGEYHACGLTDGGELSCWGDNGYGQLGVPAIARSDRPLQVDTRRYQAVAVGRNHSCALDDGGALWCFGRNYDAELGTPLPETAATPTRLGTDSDWLELGCAGTRCCARKADQSVWCWGEGEPLAASGASAERLHVLPGGICTVLQGELRCDGIELAANDVRAVVGGIGFRCVLADDALACRGDNTDANGVLGRGVLGLEPLFTAVDTGWKQLAVSARGGCGIANDGALRCWGATLGPQPSALGAERDWAALALAYDDDEAQPTHACAIRDGRLFCWGAGAAGQLGTRTDSSAPVELAGARWTKVSVGIGTTCALSEAQELRCWGAAAPNTPAPDSRWLDVSVSALRVSAVRADGTLWSWSAEASPLQLGSSASFRAVLATSSGDSCALDIDGRVQCTLDDGVTLGLLSAAPGYQQLFDMPEGVCLTQRERALECFVRGPSGGHHAGHGWTAVSGYGGDAALVLPSGPVVTLVGGFRLRCVLRADGRRECAGRRERGSFGDGLDDDALTTVLPRI